MSSAILTVLGFIVTIIAIIARVFFWNAGKNKIKLKQAEKTLTDVQKANIAASDSSFDDKLYEKYGTKK